MPPMAKNRFPIAEVGVMPGAIGYGGAVDAERAGMLGQVQLPFPAPLDQFADRAGRESGGRDSGSAG